MNTLARGDVSRLAEAHPCYGELARLGHGRMHVPVAPRCNLGCRYCERTIGPGADRASGPGAAASVLTPVEAEALVAAVQEEGWRLQVVGIAGPGEPLANSATLETLRRLSRRYPDLILCLSTNGVELAEELPALLEAGLRSVTVTINATRAEVAGQLYHWAVIEGRRLSGMAAAEETLSRQWRGLEAAVTAGLLVKVNSILIPSITDQELESVARRAAALGAHRHNIMPLIPRGRMRHLHPPAPEEVEHLRTRCERWIPQFRGCTQCRADVIAPPGVTREARGATPTPERF